MSSDLNDTVITNPLKYRVLVFYIHAHIKGCVYVLTVHTVQKLSNCCPPTLALQEELGTDIDQVLTFAPTESEKCVQFRIVDDTIALEPDEILMFRLVLTESVTGVSLGLINLTTVTLQDDDSKLVL